MAEQLMSEFPDSGPEERKAEARSRRRVLTPHVLPYEQDYCIRALSDWSLFPRLLTIQEASWLTQVPVKTMYKWHSDGKLKKVAKTIGKQLRFDREALLRMWTDETSKTTK